MRRCLLLMSLGLLFAGAQPARADFISQVLGDNPVGFWILNDAPGSPTTAIDSSPPAFNGIYASGVTPQDIAGPFWVPGSGLVADFDDGRVNFASVLDLGANGYTILAWINPSAISLTKTTRIVASGSGNDGYGFGTTAGAELVFTTYSVKDYKTTAALPVVNPTLVPDEWQYVGVVLDASNDAHFYVNGSLVQTVTGTLGTQTPNLSAWFTIGDESPAVLPPEEPFAGGIAGVSVYTTALNEAQILAQYNAATIPEASSFALNGLAAIVVGYALWRRRRNASGPVSR